MIYRYLFSFLSCFLAVVLQCQAQSSTRSYVLSRTYKLIGATEASGSTYQGAPRQVTTQITYLNGIGQPTQQVAAYSGSAYEDILNRTEYDDQLRPTKLNLPIAVGSNDGKFVSSPDYSYYNNQLQVCQPTAKAFTQTIYEYSPLNRTSETKAPGVTDGIRQSYRTDASGTVVKYVTSGATLTDIQQAGTYSANVLTYTETKDENNKTVQTYRNSYNQVILKRVILAAENLDTYYIYGESGLLRAVLQPMFQANTAPAAFATNLDQYAFLYEYDGRGNVVKKKKPGSATVTLSYDGQDRMTGMLDERSQRFYYQYDNLNRLTEMGVTRSGTDFALLNNYYDSYSFAGGYGNWKDFTNELSLTSTKHFVTNPQNETRPGLLTGSQVRILNDDDSFGSFLRSVTYYDSKGQAIQTVRELYGFTTAPNVTATERVSLELDFVGRAVRNRTTQLTGSNSYVLDKTLSYDQGDRLAFVGHKFYEGGTLKKQYSHSLLNYNGIGQLQEKQLSSGFFRLNYLYTPRGWLCNQSLGVGAIFSQSLQYNDNGNLFKQTANSYGSGSSEGIATYAYDDANRLSGYTTSGLWAGYAESNITYDKNGNLGTLNRTYATTQIDALTYKYHGNQLHRVEDLGNNSLAETGYPNGNGVESDDELTYDGAGNLTGDSNQSINTGDIVYNVLNRVRRVSQSGQMVRYIYDSQGSKQQSVSQGTVQRIYAGSFEYNGNGTLARVGLEEGQLLRDAGGAYSVQYYLKDHLGSVRMVIKEDGNVLQRTEYYGFGLAFNKDTSSVATNRYLYNEKEQQPLTKWLDYGARMYNAPLGRWMTMDPLSEVSRRLSPYNYAYNNPLRFVDPDGMDAQDKQERTDFTYTDGYATYSYNNSAIGRDSFSGSYQNAGSSQNEQTPTAQGDQPGKKKKDEKSEDSSPSKMLYNEDGQRIYPNGSLYFDVNDATNSLTLADRRAEDDPTRIIDNILAFIPSKVFGALGLFAKINAGSKAKTVIELLEVAKKAGNKLVEVKDFGKMHGQKVYRQGSRYYSFDADGHNGGYWKVFEKNGNRLSRIGTADENLDIFKK